MKLSRKAVREGLNQVPIDTVLLGVTGAQESKLTAKQREFARQLALGETKAGAYRKAYKSKGKPNSTAVQGHRTAAIPKIQLMADAYKKAIEAQRLATPAHLRALVVQQLTEKALDPDVGHSQQIRALELLGKITEVSLFTERREIVHTKPAEEIREKLLESIRAAIKNGAEDAEVRDADSLLDEIRESNLVSDNVTDSHLSSDKVTTWMESDPSADARADMADEAGAGACDSAGGETPPEGDPPRGV